MRSALCIALLALSSLCGACVQHSVTWFAATADDTAIEVAISSTETVHIVDDLVLLAQADAGTDHAEDVDDGHARIRAISARDGHEVWRTTVRLDVGWGLDVHRLSPSDIVIGAGPDLVRLDLQSGTVRWQATHPEQAQRQWFLLGRTLYGSAGDEVIAVSASSGRQRRVYQLPVTGSLIAVTHGKGRPTSVVAHTMSPTSITLMPLGHGDNHETINLRAEVDGAAGARGELLLTADGYPSGSSVVARIPRRGERTIRTTTNETPCWPTSFGAVCTDMYWRAARQGSYRYDRMNLMRLTAFGVGRPLEEPLWRVSVPSPYAGGTVQESLDGQLIVVADPWLHVLAPDSGRLLYSVPRESRGRLSCSAFGVASGHLVEGCFEQASPVLRLTPVVPALP